jgi:uncharacterized membrane protein YkvA (DUF1232 family)
MSMDICLKMDDAALAPFRSAWKQAIASNDGADTIPLSQAAREHHAGLQEGAVPDFLRAQINLIPEIASMLSDTDWQIDPQARSGLVGALAYFTDPVDLIPDRHPRFGLLDDAIVIELALAENRQEWLAWQEFAALREGFVGVGPMNRQGWADLRRELPRVLAAQRRGSYVEPRFASGEQRSRYRMLDDLPRFDMN